jgi:hypothetical protein
MMLHLERLAFPVLLMATAAAQGASVVVSVPALNAIKGPELVLPAARAERPLWTIEINRNDKGQLKWHYAAVDAAGKQLAKFGEIDKALTKGQAYAVSWSPDGKSYAFTSVTTTDGHMVNVKTLDGGQRVVRLGGSRSGVHWQITWSPDSRQLALLTYTRQQGQPTTYSLVVMDADWSVLRGPTVAEFSVPSATLAGFPPIMAPPDKLRWSPDGRRILVSWGNVVVIDAGNGAVTPIYAERAAATWTPRGDGVLYLAVSESGQRQWTGLFLQRFDGKPALQLSDAGRLSEFGLKRPGLNSGVLDLSPDGTSLAVAGGDGLSRYVLHVFPVDADGTVRLENPRPAFNFGGSIVTADWAPAGSDMAIAAILFPNPTAPPSTPVLFSTGIVSAAGTMKVSRRTQLPASPEYLDFLGQTKLLSWSR